MDEADGSVTATLQDGSGYTVSSTNGAATVSVADNDAAPGKDNWPETREVRTSGGVTVEIVDRPAGDNVVSITPVDAGISITGAGIEGTVSPAPLWSDHPRKTDPDADPGAQRVDEANGRRA